MKKISLIILLIVSQLSIAQIERELGDFNKVTSFDKIDVLLVPSKQNKIILEGEGAKEVEVINNNGELKIRMPFKKIFKGEEITATVYYKKINAVEANEGSTMTSNTSFETTGFDIIAKEGSEIKLKLNVDRVQIRASAGSKVSLEGNATNQDVLVNSGSILDAYKLMTKQTTVTVNAGGNAVIYATDFVDAKVRAGGNITIYGNPKQINQKTFAGGTITEANK
jgi:hypothetical protein